MAQIAVLPVLVGLAVDYAIQFQSRVGRRRSEPAAAGGLGSHARSPTCVGRAARRPRLGAPTIATAVAASAAATLVLVLSPVPMVRGFGVLLGSGSRSPCCAR